MRRIGIRRYEGEGAEAREDWVAEEGLLELSLGGGWRRRFVLTPERIQELPPQRRLYRTISGYHLVPGKPRHHSGFPRGGGSGGGGPA